METEERWCNLIVARECSFRVSTWLDRSLTNSRAHGCLQGSGHIYTDHEGIMFLTEWPIPNSGALFDASVGLSLNLTFPSPHNADTFA